MKTRLAVRSRSRIDNFVIADFLIADPKLKAAYCELFSVFPNRQSEIGNWQFLETFVRNVLHEVAHTAGVTPLVVIPGKDFDHVAADHFRVFGVDDRKI